MPLFAASGGVAASSIPGAQGGVVENGAGGGEGPSEASICL